MASFFFLGRGTPDYSSANGDYSSMSAVRNHVDLSSYDAGDWLIIKTGRRGTGGLVGRRGLAEEAK